MNLYHIQVTASGRGQKSFVWVELLRGDRPDEIVASVLAKGFGLPMAGHNKTGMKANILAIQIIERQLKKLNMVGRIDSYYITQVHVR